MEHETRENDASSAAETALGTPDPAITLESITFSDGTTIALQPTDVVVLVGPNNAGKSAALRELENHVRRSYQGTIVTQVISRRVGTEEALVEYLRRHTKETSHPGGTIYVCYHISISPSNISGYWSNAKGIHDLTPFFCQRLQTETRIIDSNPPPAIPVLEQPASHPIQMLYSDDELEKRINGYFQQAFGEDLVVYRLGGAEIPLLVGKNPSLQTGENRTSSSYCRRLTDSTTPLKQQGDGMRSFASVILHLLAPVTPSILMLDEPEAFLHPPQARLLGELMAKERSSRSQLFIATHSVDVINGLLNVAPDNLRVLRIRRDGDVNHVKELDKERAKQINADPLMKYSSVMSGVFHERVIICEADSDCTFYSSLLNLRELHGDHQPDVLFVHANGKDRIGALVKTLTELDVPVDVIADIDILRSADVFEDITKSLGGNWADIQPMVKAIRSSIDDNKSWSNAGAIKKEIQRELEDIESKGEFPKETRVAINIILKKGSPWFTVKAAGEAAIPKGQATQHFHNLKSSCKKMGLWIVPVGELEGFCRSVGGHGPRWVQQVIETSDLSRDSNLQGARDFVREIWAARSSG